MNDVPLVPGTICRPNLQRLRDFVGNVAELVGAAGPTPVDLDRGAALLADLIGHDDWLPDAYACPDPMRYQQYLLHCDSLERFSVVSFVWGPGQSTPIHDHRVWGLVGVLRGAERVESFGRQRTGEIVADGDARILGAGEVEAIDPDRGDIHRVANALADRPSVSIHVYGGNIGAVERATYDDQGRPKRFVSGYANATLPNLWDRSGYR